MSDAIVAWIRTVVPLGVGSALSALSTFLFDHHILFVKIDSTTAALWATGVVVAAYYTIIKWAEARWPAAGWLLGIARKPTYPTP